MELREFLEGKVPEEKLKLVPSSYEIIGSREKAVAIIEIPEDLKEWEKEIGEALLKLHKNVKSVLAKASERKTEFRVREYRLIAGSENTEVVHKEYGYLLKLDPRKVYFSSREGTERQRIAKQIKPGEFVMVFFSGVAPYVVAIVKAQPKVKKVVGIEINPDAHFYAKENIRINKIAHKAAAILGDVREKSKEFFGLCDRVVMPLPKGAYKFLDEAILCLKDGGGIIHFYHWSPEDDLFGEAERILSNSAKKHQKVVKIIGRRKVLPYAPRIWKVCIDAFIG
ncbi:MAG TPA: class I SAM-dependent methyltransferase family protein [Candidatus Aenigmarchaeota archaeon]|nr:class I SAM-dependent methyltransferase family protein [Candidatus Aenigmarchaeota archaeon]